MSSTTRASPLVDLKAPLALVAHDAGAANHLLAWAAQCSSPQRIHLRGPAAKLWQERFDTAAPETTIEEALDGAATVVTGSGWGSDVEHEARRRARALGARSIAVVDHWVNYPARFERNGEVVWPDEFWVMDAHALALARQCFPGAPVRLQPNAYLQEQIAGIGRPPSAPVLLYLLEPIRDDWGRGTPGEFQALDYLLDRLPELGLPPQLVLRLRFHPSETLAKYTEWIASHRGQVKLEVDSSPKLSDAIAGARWVAGCESYGLVVALAAGREVLGTLPPWAPSCRLPQRGIRQLRFDVR